MKISIIALFSVLTVNFSFSQPLPETTSGESFLAENEFYNLNFYKNFEDNSKISEMNKLLDDNGFHFNRESTTINSNFSEIPSGMYRGKFIMVSSKKLGALSNKGNSDAPNSNVFCLDINQKGELSRPLLFSRTVNSGLDEGQVAFSEDEKTMYFTRVDAETNNYQLFKSHLDSKNRGRWSKPLKIIFSNPDYSIENPFIHGKKLYFASNMPENNHGGYDIYVSEIHPNGNLGIPSNLGEVINTSEDEKHPFISPDKNYFYFSSNGHYGYGGFDVFRSRMHEKAFKSPKNIGASINSEKDELGFYLLDKNFGFMSSNSNSRNSLNISKIEMTPVIQFVKGKIFDSKSKNLLSGARVNLYDEYGSLLKSQITGSEGFYYFNVIPLDIYYIEVIKEDYITLKKEFNALKTKNTTYLNNLEIQAVVKTDQDLNLGKPSDRGNSDFFKKYSPEKE